MTAYAPEVVREFSVSQGMRRPDDMSPVTPPEIRYCEKYKPAEDARREREQRERLEREVYWEEAKASQAAHLAHKQRMADMRKWGPENGFFVGTRGRIAKRVVQAYNEAKGITE